jgi:hypothetical protein
MGLVEDDSVRVDMDAAGVNACALGLDECDAMLHRCAVFLLEVKKMYVTTVALVEPRVVEVEHAFSTCTSTRWRCSAFGSPFMSHSRSQIMVQSH